MMWSGRREAEEEAEEEGAADRALKTKTLHDNVGNKNCVHKQSDPTCASARLPMAAVSATGQGA